MISLKNKVVIVTGTSSGIGQATAMAFAQKGAKVVLAARRLENLEKIKKHILAFNKNCLAVKTDVTKESDIINLFDLAEKNFGQIDILINNAGRGLKANLCDISCDDWLSVINTNLTSVFLCTKEAAKRMIAKNIHGHIITVSSIAGLFGAPTYAAYCASKHGVTGFKRSIKWELIKHDIKVSTIHPARVDTAFFDIYPHRPSRRQMLQPQDIGYYLTAIAEQSLPKIIYIRLINLFKRIYNLL